MTEYAVKGESHNGVIGTLRRGFQSREEAEDHPVTMAHWKRVWVEAIEEPERDTSVPKTPWSAEVRGNQTYLRDAGGKAFATLLGTPERREKTVVMLAALGLMGDKWFLEH